MSEGHTTTIPVSGPPKMTTPVHRGGTANVGREAKDPLLEGTEATIQQVKRTGEQLYDKVCDACHNWRHYPKLLTTVLLLTAFLFGALTSASVQRMGLFGGTRHYVATHWDRDAADLHHSLDVLLDHINYPHLYQSGKGEGMLDKARYGISNLFKGILPSVSRKQRGSSMWDRVTDTGRDMYDKTIGRPSMYDKASELGEDIRYGAKRGLEQAKDVGYGLGHKLSNMAESVKDTFTGRDYDRDRWGRGGGRDDSGSWTSWFGSSSDRGRDDRDDHRGMDRNEYNEFVEAKDKLQRVTRQAEREI